MAAVTFLYPMVLAAAGAAAAPVIIHLIMRTKPRQVVFPAMRFVRKTHQANLSRLRLKHLILLLMRMAAIVLLAILIARAELPDFSSAADVSLPAAAVVIVDNSASMRYAHQGRSVLERGKRLAQQVIDLLPPDSRIAVLPTDGAGAKIVPQSDRRMVAERLSAVEAGYGARPIGPAIARALAILDEVKMDRKEVYIVSDMTAQSWRDLAAVRRKGIRFVVLNSGGGEDANISLGEARPDGTAVPVGSEVAVEAVVRSARVGGELEVLAELDGRVVDSRSVTLQPGGSASVVLTFRPARGGVAHGRVFFRQDDPLAMDNARYFTLHVQPAAGMLIVRDPSTVGRGDPASFLMGHAIAPGAAAGGWIRRETVSADRLTAERIAGRRIVMLANVSSLSAAQWGLLDRFVRAGGGVWIVAGPMMSPTSYNSQAAQRIMPAAIGATEGLAEPVAFGRGRQGDPMLQPFATGANPPLSDVRCDRRLRLAGVGADAQIPLRYADGREAIVARTVGGGQVVLWTFSPVRGSSNLAGLEQFVILAVRTAKLLAVGPGEQTMFHWGRSASVAVPRSMPNALATVRRPGSRREQPALIGLHQRVLTLPADRLGHWTVQFAEGADRVARGFSVNVEADESDLTPVTAEELAVAFPPGQLLIASSVEDLARLRRTIRQPLDLAVPILLAVLALLIGESFFANRFYRTEQAPEDAPV